ncbi:hypothetical protein [Deminuibacter soli]|uniref:Virulence factor Evf domain-containing protein n=1 Tax=Deminuibacter soli TaxID=2291815 RepID=A0A3E1NG32_9BACT|nr:hypothetical protein [Deminuibacter soli]RFM26923.1 hypothetical protein DXN05_18235 [Deminuibacter soli]
MPTHDVEKFIKSLELADAASTYPTDKDLTDAEKFVEGKEQAFLNDRSIFSFAADTTGQIREDVLNSTLLAQLAANKAYSDPADLVKWQKKFAEVLKNLGWIVEGTEFQTFSSAHDLVEVEQVIVDILTASFGAAIIPIITKTLDAIKGLANTDGKIKAFERNTTAVSKGVFQLGVATQKNDLVALQLGSFIISTENKITRILFFKIEKDRSTLDYNSQKATLVADNYAKVRETIKEKLGEKTQDYIAGIEI